MLIAQYFQRFKKAAEDVTKLKTKPSNDDLLEIYALFKQGSVGDINTGVLSDFCVTIIIILMLYLSFYLNLFLERPGMLDLKGKAKWDAWNAKKGLNSEKAKEQYIAKVQSLIDSLGLQ